MSSSIKLRVNPTRIELIRLKRSLKVAEKVHDILEDKRDVLLRRLDEMIEQAGMRREELWSPLSEAYRSLFDAYLKMGPLSLESVALTTPVRIDATVNIRTIVDVDVPTLQVTEEDIGVTYGFADTNVALDQTTRLMRRLLPTIFKAAEAENAIFRLANELERTQRLINALEYVIIPQYRDSIKFISSTLEERAREDFVKLKHVKRVLERRKLVV